MKEDPRVDSFNVLMFLIVEIRLVTICWL